MKLAELQAQFQRDILEGSDGVLARIPDSPRESKETLFGVYRNAYVIRLADFLKNDFERLHTYAGDELFERLANEYIAGHPSHDPNARWYGRDFPEFLRAHLKAAKHAPVADIAKLEGALNDAFDVEDAPVLTLAALAAVPPEDWEHLTFKPHPSAHILTTETNLLDIWTALAEEAAPPRPRRLTEPLHILVWRQDLTSMYRALGAEEAMMWREAAQGVTFGVLCELAATYDAPDEAAIRAAQYLQTWISSGALSSAELAPARNT